MKNKFLPILFVLGFYSAYSQVVIGKKEANPSTQLEIYAADKGVLFPRVALTSLTDARTIVGGNVNSLFVFNTATSIDLKPGYYYWLNNKWNRILISSDASIAEGTVIFNPVSNTFSYIDQNGNQQIINFKDLVKNNETITTLVNAADGKHTYTSENNTATVIDVVGDVTNNAPAIFNNPAVVTELTNIIKNKETLTSLVYDAAGNTLTYTPENGVPTVVNLLNLVQGTETQTSLIYDSVAQTLTYNPENRVSTVINLSNLVKGLETITTITPAVTTGNVIANYSNEAGNSVDIQETITTHSQNPATGDITYTNEAGTVTSSKVISSNAGNLIAVGTDGGSFIDKAAITANETVTTITPVVTTGNVIANYSNEAGNSVDIQETITTHSQNPATGDITYTNEAGTVSSSKVISANAGNLIAVGTDGGSFIDKAAITANETVTTITPVVTTGNVIAKYANETGDTPVDIRETATTITPVVATGNVIARYSNEAGNSVDIQETITTHSQNPATGDITYTNEAGTVSSSKVISSNAGNLIAVGTDGGSFIDKAAITANETVTTITPVVTTGNIIAQYANETGDTPVDIRETATTITPLVATGNVIASYSNEAGNSVDIQETITTHSQNPATGDITYTNEAGTVSSSKVISSNAGNLIAVGTDGGSFIDKAAITANETVTTITPVVTTGNIIAQYANETGDTPVDIRETATTITPLVSTGNVIARYSNEAGNSVDIQETLTSLSYEPKTSTLSYSSENGTTTPLDLTELKSLVTAGTNVTVTGNGKTGTPYVINSPVETALLTPSVPIVASATTIAVPSTNVQGAIEDLATELKQKWDIRGNLGTNASINFIGTRDDNDLVFKRYNVRSGLLSVDNNSFGVNALNPSSTGINNAAFGSNALRVNTTGSLNTAVGADALKSNTTGQWNTAIGYGALAFNTNGQQNTAIGTKVLFNNGSGSANIGIGINTMNSNVSGNDNIGVGNYATNTNRTGSGNIAFGTNALRFSDVGNNNIAIGTDSGTHVGASGGALASLVDNSIFIGVDTRTAALGDTNQIVIGNNAVGKGSNTIQLGNNQVTGVYTSGSMTASAFLTSSDKRLKKDINNSPFGLNFITKLRPVTYYMKNETTDLKSGFIAQEVEAVANSLNYEFSGVSKPANTGDFYSLNYAAFVVPLVKAVQEQQDIIEDQYKKISDLETRLKRLETLLDK
ncbi:tail fiber domain-containing protein [Flavobacterium defluvii]|uniref:Chaperone of endosialidase n=1 Tax=Flavobacterium defluvii TaxID=370979 RepID=A0A1M5U1E3_9FLAO|nr:tail fiber domain-containing protein [Flavobacterium defluvii]SHH56778.1 Chaperone of endosialidase [Flavobacterium defluvii]